MNALDLSLQEKPATIKTVRQMTIREIYHVMYVGKKQNDAKVTLTIVRGVRTLNIHDFEFDSFENALNYLREDQRNIVAPENRKPVELTVVS